jgi:ribosome-binding protein aMBF1 (putative translation factor)
MDENKKFYTQEEMLDKYIGKVGTPERDEFDAEVMAEAQEYFIGEAIRETRKKQGLTQEELGQRMGVQRAQVSKLENGHGIAYSTIMRAFKALGVPSAYLDLGSFGRVALW